MCYYQNLISIIESLTGNVSQYTYDIRICESLDRDFIFPKYYYLNYLQILQRRFNLKSCHAKGQYIMINCMHEGTKISHNYDEEFKKNHISTNLFQKTLLGVGSAAMAIFNPARGDMIACMGETTGKDAIQFMKQKMEESDEGKQILQEQPRVHSSMVDLERLKTLPEGSLGKTYSNFLEFNKVTPDARAPVQFVDDKDLAFVMQRYRDVHDLTHAVLGMRTNMLGECTVKWVEAIQTRLPMCIGGALFGAVRLQPKHRKLYLDHYLPWAIKTGYNTNFLMSIYYEKRWEQPLEELYEEINFKPLILPHIDNKKN